MVIYNPAQCLIYNKHSVNITKALPFYGQNHLVSPSRCPPILSSIPHSRHEIFVCPGVISFSLFSARCIKFTYFISFYFIPATITYVLKVHKSPSGHTSLLNYRSTLSVIQQSPCGENDMKVALAW